MSWKVSKSRKPAGSGLELPRQGSRPLLVKDFGIHPWKNIRKHCSRESHGKHLLCTTPSRARASISPPHTRALRRRQGEVGRLPRDCVTEPRGENWVFLTMIGICGN